MPMNDNSFFDPAAMQIHADDAVRLLRALANARRLRILCILAENEMTVGQINEKLPALSQSALSQHLARLRDEGLVATQQKAQSVRYSLAPGPARAVIATLYDIYCAPDGKRMPGG